MSPSRLPHQTHQRARDLRTTTTEPEAILWSRLRAHRLKDTHFRRQYAIGKFVVDFCAPRNLLVIELDGSQHLDAEKYDIQRTIFLTSKGYRVLRFWNNDVMQHLDDVVAEIERALDC